MAPLDVAARAARPALTASPSTGGVTWLAQDDGLVAVDEDGARLAAFDVDTAGAVIIDVAAAPCPDFSGPCLWIASIVDDVVAVVALREPAVVTDGAPPLDGAPRDGDVLAPLYAYRYGLVDDDGRPLRDVDVAAMVVWPDVSSIVFIEAADEGPARMFVARAPLSPDDVVPIAAPAALAVPLTSSRVVSADVRSDAARLVVRTADAVVEYEIDRALAVSSPVVTDAPGGGAVAYDAAGALVGTGGAEGAAVLQRWPCARPGGTS